MKNMIDVYDLLKKYGAIIYTGNRMGDLELIEDEIKELYRSKMIEPKQFQTAILIIRQEKTRLQTGNVN